MILKSINGAFNLNPCFSELAPHYNKEHAYQPEGWTGGGDVESGPGGATSNPLLHGDGATGAMGRAVGEAAEGKAGEAAVVPLPIGGWTSEWTPPSMDLARKHAREVNVFRKRTGIEGTLEHEVTRCKFT